MKKYKLRAVAGTMALLMVLSSGGMGIAKAEDALLAGENVPVATEAPVADLSVQEADGAVLVVTVEMADENGVIFIQGGEWEKIVISRDVEAKSIVLENVTAKELCVESGNRYVVEVKGGTITKAFVQTPELEVIDYEKIVALLKEGVPAGEVVEKYKAYQAEKELIARACPTLLTSEDAEIETVTVAGGAKLDLNAGKVGEIAVSSGKTTERVVVSIQNYDGKVTVDQTSTADGTNNLLSIQLKNSKLAEFNVTGAEKSICYIEGDKNSNVAVVNVGGAPSITVNVDAAELNVAETAEKSSVRIYSDVQNVEVKADNSRLSLAASAVVENAKVEGDNVKVSYTGTIANAEISGSGSSAEYVPVVTATPKPTVAPTMTPTATPKPTVAPTMTPTETPKPTSFPIPTITPGGGTGTATGGALVTPMPTAAPTEAPKPTEIPEPTPTPMPEIEYTAEGFFEYEETEEGIVITQAYPWCYDEASGEENQLGEVLNVPATIAGKPVVEIAAWAFQTLYETKEINIPDGVLCIGGYAFPYNVERITIPASVTTLSDEYDGSAFGLNYCYCLKEIIVDAGNEYFSSIDNCLYNADATELIFMPQGLNVNTFEIPSTVISVANYAIEGSIGTLVLSKNVQDFKYESYANGFVGEITVAEDNIYFRDYEKYILSTDKSQIIYARSGIEKFVIPKTMVNLNMGVFAMNGNVPLAFSIEEGNTSFCMVDGVLYNAAKTRLLHYTTEAKESCLILPETVNFVSDYAFMNNTKLQEVVIPASVRSIGVSAFEGCTNLRSFYMEDGETQYRTNLSSRMCYGCSSLVAVRLSETVFGISVQAFFECNSLQSLYIPESVRGLSLFIERNSPIVLYTRNENLVYQAERYGWTVVKQ